MVSIYSLKRKEPRVKLNTRVTVMIAAEDSNVSVETTTADVSPHGASVRLAEPLTPGTVVRFAALRYPFTTRAIVRSALPDRSTGGYLIGLEYLDETNPIVVWSRAGEPEVACEPTS